MEEEAAGAEGVPGWEESASLEERWGRKGGSTHKAYAASEASGRCLGFRFGFAWYTFAALAQGLASIYTRIWLGV